MFNKCIGPAAIVLLAALQAGVFAQCDVLPGQTVYVTTSETCGQMSIAGTLIIESTGSITGGDGSTLNGAGATITVNGGSLTINGRFNVGQGSDGYINMNGGTFTVTGTFKFPDEDGGIHRMWLNDGIMHSDDIQLYYDRNAIIYVGAGILRLNTVIPGNAEYDPAEWVTQGALLPAEGYDEIVIEDKGAYTEISAVSAYPRVEFDSDSSEALETVPLALLGVTLSEPVGQTVTVDYAVAGGSATDGVDYTLLGTGTLTFDACETTATIGIDVNDDGQDEDDETVIVELSNPVGGGTVLGNTSQHTYTIIDPRPAVQFASTASSDTEDDTSVNIPVELSAAVPSTVTVDYAVTGGTASGGGTDYTLLGDGTIEFVPFDVAEDIDLTVVDDTETESAETIQLTLSNVTGSDVRLGGRAQHTYTIVDNDAGLRWNGLVWFYSEDPSPLTVTGEGDLFWDPEGGEQIITRLPEQSLSTTGDYVEITYWWLTDGDHDCPDCFDCGLYCFDDDITCIAGTSDMRAGLFEADGEYITQDGFDVSSSSIWAGYKGYAWRFGPNMKAGPTRWVDCTGEVHKTGNFQKKPASLSNLMYSNDGLEDYIPGFELPPGEWSLWTISLEKLSSGDVEVSITLNDRTYTWTDDSSSDQPSKIDVFAIHMRNHRPYDVLKLGRICQPPPGDADGNCTVDWHDLRVLGQNWLTRCRYGPGCGDFTNDFRVNLPDYVALSAHWLEVSE